MVFLVARPMSTKRWEIFCWTTLVEGTTARFLPMVSFVSASGSLRWCRVYCIFLPKQGATLSRFLMLYWSTSHNLPRANALVFFHACSVRRHRSVGSRSNKVSLGFRSPLLTMYIRAAAYTPQWGTHLSHQGKPGLGRRTRCSETAQTSLRPPGKEPPVLSLGSASSSFSGSALQMTREVLTAPRTTPSVGMVGRRFKCRFVR